MKIHTLYFVIEKELLKTWSKKDTQLFILCKNKAREKVTFLGLGLTKHFRVKLPELKNDGCIVTAKQCENKYKALKMECRATFDHNSKCGHDRQSYTFLNEFSKLHVYMV